MKLATLQYIAEIETMETDLIESTINMVYSSPKVNEALADEDVAYMMQSLIMELNERKGN